LTNINTVAQTADQRTITLQYFDTLRNMATSPSTKWFFPLEFTGMVGNLMRGLNSNRSGGPEPMK
jgi:hypothetical protein